MQLRAVAKSLKNVSFHCLRARSTWRNLLSEMTSTLIFEWTLYPWLRFWSHFGPSLDGNVNWFTSCCSATKFLDKLLTFNMNQGGVLARVHGIPTLHNSGAWRAIKMQSSDMTESSRPIISFLLQDLPLVHYIQKISGWTLYQYFSEATWSFGVLRSSYVSGRWDSERQEVLSDLLL